MRRASVVTCVPYGMRDDRHGCAGLSQLGSPAFWASIRMSCLLMLASTNGDRTEKLVAAFMPGR